MLRWVSTSQISPDTPTNRVRKMFRPSLFPLYSVCVTHILSTWMVYSLRTAIVGLLGIFTAAAAQTAYGKVMWNPVEIIGLWLDSGSHAGRASAAFAAIGLIIVTLGINISANSISAANDLMAFCPKYINIRRGQLLAAIIGSWAFVPVSLICLLACLPWSLLTKLQWKILASAAKFLAFLSGYTIFLGPMTSILMTEYVNPAVPTYNVHIH